MYTHIRPHLFRTDPERAHALTLNLLRLAGNLPLARWFLAQLYKVPDKPARAFGLSFRNCVGLAAGYDKDGVAVRGLFALGFGHVEIGTVTPLPQPGNPRPRLFRLVEDEALINRMGFPSRGSEFVQKQLDPQLRGTVLEKIPGFRPRSPKNKAPLTEKGNLILGVNIGMNRDTPTEKAVLDYISLVDCFSRLADYLTVNISSPNTAGLRQLQQRNALETLLTHIHKQRALSEKANGRRLPILVKLAPDLADQELDDAVEAILHAGMDGIIVTNTTLARNGLRSAHQHETGGLSGRPLKERSEVCLARTLRQVKGGIPVVSAGGIIGPEDARKRLEMGAALVQVYTGLVYRGPGLVRQIVEAL
jgi:dihydroorotate dehydrogenase